MYSKGKIYKVVNTSNNECYYGSTVQPLSKRMGQHRASYKLYKEGKCRAITSFDLFNKYGVENCSIVLVENYDCKSKEELDKKERWYIENNECVNKVIPGRNKKDYYKDNKENFKKNYEYNKDKIKEWYESNKDKLLNRKREYREENKEKLSERRKDKYLCECGSDIRKDCKLRHGKSKKHIEYIELKK
jgi:hypothetical protein